MRKGRDYMPINSADLGFKKKIWDVADKLMGNIGASEYEHVVSGLIFLKYISDSFEKNTGNL